MRARSLAPNLCAILVHLHRWIVNVSDRPSWPTCRDHRWSLPLIASALVHRDYTANGPTIVKVSQDALVVSNPGGLPEGVTTSNLLITPPRPRNPALADAFKRAGVVERTGRGINRAFASQLALGKPVPDYSRSTFSSVVARVRSGPADKELAGFVAHQQEQTVLTFVKRHGSITRREASELCQIDSQ
ncbi:ATP-binding protein [Candidatus Poriferisocius sp.]|uniref:ATP-binding protein n=1 Tax=Candidatus Poriferisocius sp. TaxID=3101276 RepID=UPI003B01CE8D